LSLCGEDIRGDAAIVDGDARIFLYHLALKVFVLINKRTVKPMSIKAQSVWWDFGRNEMDTDYEE